MKDFEKSNLVFRQTVFGNNNEILNTRKIKSDELGRMNGENLIKKMKIDIESGLTSVFVAATLGTTGLCVGLFTQMKLPEKVIK